MNFILPKLMACLNYFYCCICVEMYIKKLLQHSRFRLLLNLDERDVARYAIDNRKESAV